MEYFATASGPKVHERMDDGTLCQITTPAAGNAVRKSVRRWCADNAVFANKYPGDAKYLAWLGRRAWAAGRCTFAVAPDVVGDAVATLARSMPMFDRIRAAGFPVALAFQDGLDRRWTPWDCFDVAFIGGSTDWKLGQQAEALAWEARCRGKWVHMGRVNSALRVARAVAMGLRFRGRDVSRLRPGLPTARSDRLA